MNIGIKFRHKFLDIPKEKNVKEDKKVNNQAPSNELFSFWEVKTKIEKDVKKNKKILNLTC